MSRVIRIPQIGLYDASAIISGVSSGNTPSQISLGTSIPSQEKRNESKELYGDTKIPMLMVRMLEGKDLNHHHTE